MGWHQTKLSGWAWGVADIHLKQQMTSFQPQSQNHDLRGEAAPQAFFKVRGGAENNYIL